LISGLIKGKSQPKSPVYCDINPAIALLRRYIFYQPVDELALPLSLFLVSHLFTARQQFWSVP
jgi:hypothetical protein